MRQGSKTRLLFITGCVLSLVTGGAAGTAAQATPEPLSAVACTVEPLSLDEQRAAVLAGAPRVLAFMQGTPAPSDRDTIGDTPSTPADPETTTRVVAAVEQFVACTNAGDVRQTAALMTDQGRANFLGFFIYPYLKLLHGKDFDPATATISPEDVNLVIGSMQLPVPLPASRRITLVDVSDIRMHAGGVITAEVTLREGDGEAGSSGMILRLQDGEYRIVFGAETFETAGSATPTP